MLTPGGDPGTGTLGAVVDDPTPDPTPPAPSAPNAWLVDEMHEQYLADPSSVSESWRDLLRRLPAAMRAEPQAAPARRPGPFAGCAPAAAEGGLAAGGAATP